MRFLIRMTVAAFVLLATVSAAGAVDFTNYTNTSRIDACVSDTNYVWFGTFGGLKRYNKAFGTWTVYTTANGLDDNWVYALLMKGNRLYIGTINGLNYTDDNGATISNVATLDNEVVTCLANRGDTIWAGTYSGLYRSINAGASWAISYAAEGFNDLSSVDGDTLIWGGPFSLASGNGTGLKYSVNDGQTWSSATTFPFSDVYSLVVQPETIVVGTWGGGVYISPDTGTTWTAYTTAQGLGSVSIYDIAIDGGIYWAACSDSGGASGGYSRSANGGLAWTNSTMVNGHNNGFTIAVDGSRVWGGAAGGGISSTIDGGNNWTTYTDINGVGGALAFRGGLPSELQGMINVYDVDVYNNTIWAASTPGAISKSTDGGASWTNYTVLNGIPDTNAQAIVAGQNAVWAGTAGGLVKTINGGTSWTTYTTVSGLGSNNVFSLALHGDTVYVGTGRNASGAGGVSVSGNNGASWTTYAAADGMTGDTVYGIAVTFQTVWAATNTGLFRSQNWGDTWDAFTTDTSGFPNNLVYDVAVTMDTVWVATPGGVAKSAPPYMTWTNYTIANGFDTTSNYSLRIDGDSIWVGSSKNGGLTTSRDDGLTWINMKAPNVGLVDNYIYGIDVDGNYLYLAGKNGISRYNKLVPEALITYPEHGQPLTSGIEAITGNAIDYENIASWDLYSAPGAYPNQGAFVQIGTTGSANVANSLLRSWTVSDFTAGDTTLRLRVTDGAGLTNTQYIVITIPSTGGVVFTSPGEGEEVGGLIYVTCTASDSDGVAQVEWQYSTASANGPWTDAVADSGTNPDTISPYTFRWQTIPASGKDNSVWLRARLLDNLGFYSPYVIRSISVNNDALDPTVANTVNSTDLLANLYLPPNALGGATVVTLTKSTSVSDHPDAAITAIGVAYEVYPDGTGLNKPGTLTIKWTDADIGAFTEGSFTLYGWNTVTSAWEKVGGTLDAGANSLTAAIINFRQYAVMEDLTGVSEFPAGLSQVNAQPRVFSPGGNGFSDHLDISFTLGAPENVTIRIYALNGRLKRLLLDNIACPVGSNVVPWNGSDDEAELLPNGLYIVTIEAGGATATKVVKLMSK